MSKLRLSDISLIAANSSSLVSRSFGRGVRVGPTTLSTQLNKKGIRSLDMERKDVEIMIENLEIKTDLKFERLVGESNLKFANMMAESRRAFDETMAESRRLFDEAKAESRRLSDEAKAESDLKFSKGQTMIAEAESKHAKWVIGLAFTMIGFVIASVGLSTNMILRAVDRQQNIQAAPQPPVIINVPSASQAETQPMQPQPAHIKPK